MIHAGSNHYRNEHCIKPIQACASVHVLAGHWVCCDDLPLRIYVWPSVFGGVTRWHFKDTLTQVLWNAPCRLVCVTGVLNPVWGLRCNLLVITIMIRWLLRWLISGWTDVLRMTYFFLNIWAAAVVEVWFFMIVLRTTISLNRNEKGWVFPSLVCNLVKSILFFWLELSSNTCLTCLVLIMVFAPLWLKFQQFLPALVVVSSSCVCNSCTVLNPMLVSRSNLSSFGCFVYVVLLLKPSCSFMCPSHYSQWFFEENLHHIGPDWPLKWTYFPHLGRSLFTCLSSNYSSKPLLKSTVIW